VSADSRPDPAGYRCLVALLLAMTAYCCAPMAEWNATEIPVTVELPALGEAELKAKSGMLGIDRSAGLWPAACRPEAGATFSMTEQSGKTWP
jgi:hypothetical protein